MSTVYYFWTEDRYKYAKQVKKYYEKLEARLPAFLDMSLPKALKDDTEITDGIENATSRMILELEATIGPLEGERLCTTLYDHICWHLGELRYLPDLVDKKIIIEDEYGKTYSMEGFRRLMLQEYGKENLWNINEGLDRLKRWQQARKPLMVKEQ